MGTVDFPGSLWCRGLCVGGDMAILFVGDFKWIRENPPPRIILGFSKKILEKTKKSAKFCKITTFFRILQIFII